MTTDETLVLRYRDGDASAFEELYERYVRRIYDFVYYKTHQKQLTEDIVSQTFLQALEKIDAFRPQKGVFSAWLHRIARNLVIDHYRAQHPTKDIEDVWDLSSDDDVVADTDTRLKIESVRAVLAQLKPVQREVVLLRLWNGYAFKEIAAMLGTTEGACKMNYKRALQTVRTDLLVLLFLSLLSHS